MRRADGHEKVRRRSVAAASWTFRKFSRESRRSKERRFAERRHWLADSSQRARLPLACSNTECGPQPACAFARVRSLRCAINVQRGRNALREALTASGPSPERNGPHARPEGALLAFAIVQCWVARARARLARTHGHEHSDSTDASQRPAASGRQSERGHAAWVPRAANRPGGRAMGVDA